MKSSLFLLPFLAVGSAVAVAQPKPAPPQFVVEPAAKAMLDGVTATYRSAKAVRFKLAVKEDETQSNYSVSFQKPNLLRLEKLASDEAFKVIADGKALYGVEGTTYKREELSAKAAKRWRFPGNSGAGVLMPAMLEGRSPLVVLQDSLKKAPFANARMTVVMPPPASVNGVALHGVKINITTHKTSKATPNLVSEIYIWFGDDGLLRRLSTRLPLSKRLWTEQLSEQELNPTFEPEAFKFNATGLQLQTAAEEEAYYDARLKVGSVPFAFSAKTLTGQTVSPSSYKGKVLILDFWATWCGPCVAAMPELKSVYAKYHPKGLEVVGISLDEDKKALTSFLKTQKITWAQVFDGKGWSSRVPGMYGVKAIPFMLIIGKDGKIAAIDPSDDLEGAVKKALAAS